MIEIRFHGRGGQGALVAARILGAALAKEGKEALVIPEFGSERRSAPVAIGLRADESKIFLRSKIYNPNIVIILDESLLDILKTKILAGLKTNGTIILNCNNLDKIKTLTGLKIGHTNADAIARKYKLGPASLPAVGTAMLGAFAKATGFVNLKSILEAASESNELPKKDENIAAIEEIFNNTETYLDTTLEERAENKTGRQGLGLEGHQSLPISIISLGNTKENKTGTWRRINPKYSLPKDTISTCMISCPIHQDIREWLLALKTGNVKKAAKIILRHNPLTSSVGRVCPAFCEKGCKHFRNGFDEPIAINLTERFLGDKILGTDYCPRPAKIRSDKKVAIIGSGPAGLTCAYILRNRGYAVSVLEKNYVLGGLLRTGIPEDRLPKDIIFKEVNLILKAGVEFRSGIEINESNFYELKKDFKAIFLAPGLSEGKKLNIPGSDLEEVTTALDFLKKSSIGEITNLAGKTIIIIGGGNTAMDSARIAQKIGARTIIAYRRKKEDMKAFGNEIEETEKTGVQFNFEMTPLKIAKNIPQGLIVEFQNNNLKVILGCDLVIMAVGQQKSPFFEKLLREKTIEKLEKEGIFIGGDLLNGPKTVAHAIGSGNEEAKKIIAYLTGKRYCRGKIRRQIKRGDINFDYFEPRQRIASTESPNLPEIKKESSRCFTCGFCDRCGNCWIFCPDRAISEKKEGLKIDYDFCKGCQICFNECPRSVITSKLENDIGTSTQLDANKEAKNA